MEESGREAVITELLAVVDPSEPDLHTVHCEVQQSQSLDCPNCQDNDIRANGKANGVQRYFCKSSKKYFSKTTGNVTFGLKKWNLLKPLLAPYALRQFDKEMHRTNRYLYPNFI